MPETRELQIVAWMVRDGSIHLEMQLASFHNDTGKILTHIDGGHHPNGYSRFESLCGESYWGKGSATGLGRTHRVTCEECITLLRKGRGSIVIERG